MNPKVKQFLINIIVAICSAIITFFSSCSTMWVKGDYNAVTNEQKSTLSSDSTSFIRIK